MGPVDVVMLTRNSERFLSKCLKSVYENVPVKRLIVVDAFSTDDTLRIIDGFNREYGNVKIISERSSRGEARQRGIHEVETEWFMFVDSDVVLCEGWFKKAIKQVREDVGAIWGVDIPGNVNSRVLTRILQRMEGRVFSIRGGCHDILIRHGVVKDIKIPGKLHVLEDAYIREWIVSKNYRAVVSYDSYCRHYKEANSLFSEENRLSTVFELRNIRLVKERLIYGAVFALVWLLEEAKSRNQKQDLA